MSRMNLASVFLVANLAAASAASPSATPTGRHVALVCAVCPESLMLELAERMAREFRSLGYRPGTDLRISTHRLDGTVPGDSEMRTLYASIVALRPQVILPMDIYATAAAKSVLEIPIVFGASATDAAALGLSGSVARPDSNMTGFSQPLDGLDAKRLGLLHAMVPHARRVAVLAQRDVAAHAGRLAEVKAAAASLGIEAIEFWAGAGKTIPEDVDAVFARMAAERIDAFLLLHGNAYSSRLVELAARQRLPTIYPYGRPVRLDGGLASYAADGWEYAHVAGYASQILRGRKPKDLPVQARNRFNFLLNPKAAERIGLRIPGELLLMATEVIGK